MTMLEQFMVDGFGLIAAMGIAAGLYVFSVGFARAAKRIAAWRTRRRLQKRMRNLPPPDDPRQRNVVSLQDWKNRETCEKRFRTAA